ncbi:MerR family transcriptional regulator [Salmonella enterica subsp. enterica]|uniref:MerR family transcriptional regulator n=1 Tax=Salmonella enterica I TaxID=59201 RepID=A0A447MTC0_SALET|nr:MerR family transcriptional regulator [Salmonella enterica subsp. enterica]
MTHLLRPLRSKVSAHLPAVMTLREILDGIIIAYTSFCLEGDRKAPGNNAFISGWNLSDHCEIWLEALTRTGQELRLNVLPSPPVVLAPELFAQRKWFLVTTGKLTARAEKTACPSAQRGRFAGGYHTISAEIDFFPSFYLIDI